MEWNTKRGQRSRSTTRQRRDHILKVRLSLEDLAGGQEPHPGDGRTPLQRRFRQALAKRDWVIRKDIHERLKAMKPASDRDRFYKAFYLTRSSYGKQRGGSFNPANGGV